METFGAPWGKTLRWSSAIVTVLVLGGLVATAPLHRNWLGWVIFAFLVLLLPGAALFTVRGYAVTADAILVRRLFWYTRIPRAGLLSAMALPHAMKGSIRTCGNGGMYSFTGWYWSKALGRFQPYVTDLNHTVVLRWEKKTVVLSPDDPEGFVRALSE